MPARGSYVSYLTFESTSTSTLTDPLIFLAAAIGGYAGFTTLTGMGRSLPWSSHARAVAPVM